MARRLSQQETFDPATNSQEAVQLGVRLPAFAAFLQLKTYQRKQPHTKSASHT
jgi:hypothetical protein